MKTYELTSAPVEMTPHTCPTCGTEYPSFARFTRHDACYQARHLARCDAGIARQFATPDPVAYSVDAPEYGTGTGRAIRIPDAPTAKQIEWLTKFGIEVPATKREASKLLDAAFAANPKPAAGSAAPARRNRFAAPCSKCGGQVPAETGNLTRSPAGAWVVSHDGECPTVEAAPAAPVAPLPEVPEGHYAVASKGANDLLFVRVDRPSDGKWAGRTFVKMIVGGRPDSPIRGGQARDVLARIVEAGVDAAAKLYGTEIGRCFVCNRELTDELSRELGIGPVCRENHG